MHNEIRFEELSGVSGRIGVIILNRTTAMNALTHGMVLAMREQLNAWDLDTTIQAVIIRSNDPRAFCAGGDIRQLYEAKKHPIEKSLPFFADEYRLNRQIYHYQKPYIAFLDGVAMGGGLGISLHGSHRVGTEKLTLAMPETGIGFFPDVGGSYFLSRCPQNIGIYLGLTGERLKVADAVYAHLVHAYVPSARLDHLQTHLLSVDLSQDPDNAINQVINFYRVDVELPPLSDSAVHIEKHFQYETIEAILDSLQEKNDTFSEKTRHVLSKMSPFSLKVTLHQLTEGKIKDFDACMQMEYRMVKRFLQGHDLYEGIRALLIDKDCHPHWKPERLDEINQAMIDAYFEPLPEGELL